MEVMEAAARLALMAGLLAALLAAGVGVYDRVVAWAARRRAGR